MTITNGYVTEDQLRSHFRDAGERLDTDGIHRSINAASRWIDQVCGRRFWQDGSVVARTFWPAECEVAWVDDISTTTGLIIATDTAGDGTYATTWASTDYALQPQNASADDGAYAWWSIRAVGDYQFITGATKPSLRVTAKWGWSAVPDEVEEACLLKAAALYQRRESPLGVASYGDFGPIRISRSDPDIAAMLEPYIRLDMLVA